MPYDSSGYFIDIEELIELSPSSGVAISNVMSSGTGFLIDIEEDFDLSLSSATGVVQSAATPNGQGIEISLEDLLILGDYPHPVPVVEITTPKSGGNGVQLAFAGRDALPGDTMYMIDFDVEKTRQKSMKVISIT